jgi:crotonobetainyl-CoA:carnitine CoA-transferase CaiB-like acyl-CoA transferase
MQLPLEGKVILDLSRMLPGPYCSMILSDLGAEVIRVEDANYPYGNPPPFYEKGTFRESAFQSILMRNKKSITLNLKNDEARDIFYRLVKQADVVLDTFRPKVMHKLKIDYKTLASVNPSIICCSLTGYGQNGPYEQVAGHDLNYIGICGILDLTKERKIFGKEHIINPPMNPGVQVADIGGGLVAAIGILGGLIERDNNPDKKGQFIDISMTDSVFSFIPMIAAYHFARDPSEGVNILHGDYPCYSVFKTKDDRFLSLGIIEVKFWREFCMGIRREDLIPYQFFTGAEREKLFDEIQSELLKKTQEEWMEIFINLDACVMPVKSFEEACEDPQIKIRNMVVEVDHPKLGKIKNISSPIKYSRTPLSIRGLAPKTGQDNDQVLSSLGYTDKEIRSFKEKGML